jgi:hypothetical protein
MQLLKNIKLVMDINKFYKNHYEGAYTKVQLKDLSNPAWLSEIQYDINEMLEDYEQENTQFVRFLMSINKRLTQRSE